MEINFEKAEENEIKAWFEAIVQFKDKDEPENAFTIVVSYRGRWCMYCRHYLQVLASMHKQIVKMGGRVLVFCSQKQEKADEAKEHWELPFDFVLGDPLNNLAKMLKSNDLVQPIITGDDGDEGYTTENYVKFARKRKHMHGIVQPSILIISSDMQTMFKWRIEPKLKNAQGAGGRPDLKTILAVIGDKQSGEVEMDKLCSLKELKESGYQVKTVNLYNPVVLFLLIKKLFGKA